MTMPVDLVLVRHGESEGNLANKHSRAGDDRDFSPEFMNRHSSKWRLTSKGRDQAIVAGGWIKKNISPVFDRYYTSEYLRAMETAVIIALPHAVWYREFYLRERDWGILDVMPDEERRTRFASEMKRREIDSFFWVPPGGESMANLCLRIDRVLNTLHRECADKSVIIVCHGEVIWGFRVRLERMSQQRYQELKTSENPFDRIHNCQIVHYTRRDPVTASKVMPHLDWMRSVCPSDLKLSKNEWEMIYRRQYSNEELMAEIAKTPQLVSE